MSFCWWCSGAIVPFLALIDKRTLCPKKCHKPCHDNDSWHFNRLPPGVPKRGFSGTGGNLSDIKIIKYHFLFLLTTVVYKHGNYWFLAYLVLHLFFFVYYPTPIISRIYYIVNVIAWMFRHSICLTL